MNILVTMYLKKNQNAPRPSEHPPVRGKKCQNGYVLMFVVMLGYDWWLCMVINISVQQNGGLLPDIILLTQGYTTIREPV